MFVGLGGSVGVLVGSGSFVDVGGGLVLLVAVVGVGLEAKTTTTGVGSGIMFSRKTVIVVGLSRAAMATTTPKIVKITPMIEKQPITFLMRPSFMFASS